MTARTLHWADPPPKYQSKRPRKSKYAHKYAGMKKNPGRWLLIAKASNGSCVGLVKNRGFEVTTRAVGKVNGKYVVDVYARMPKLEVGTLERDEES
jgi:hypothetical protein